VDVKTELAVVPQVRSVPLAVIFMLVNMPLPLKVPTMMTLVGAVRLMRVLVDDAVNIKYPRAAPEVAITTSRAVAFKSVIDPYSIAPK